MSLRMMIKYARIRELRRLPKTCVHTGRTARVPCLAVAVIVLMLSVGPVAGQGLRPLGHPPAVPIGQAADVILVLKPDAKYSLHIPATVDRIVQGDIVRLEKGTLPHTIVHTRSTMGSPLAAGVPVKLFLKEFRDGHAHYIIGAFPEWYGGQQ